MQQQLPHKPNHVSDADWSYILKRDKHRCVLQDRCLREGVNAPCDEYLDIDHAQPRELGGDDSFANQRLLCRGYNRGRPCEPLMAWVKPNYWDHRINQRGLREIQEIAGPQAVRTVVESGKAELKDIRRHLLSSIITLLPGATGIGKTLLVQAVLFELNRLIGSPYPRVRHVLWLTTDTTLRDLAAREIEGEAYELGIVERRPTVMIATSFADLQRGHQNGAADVMVAAEQSLWKVEKEGQPRRSDDEKREVLQAFDTIIFDEGDWGNGQIREIANLATHALKFAPTASPLVTDVAGEQKQLEQFARQFVLISNEAVADYKRARLLDACLKEITDPFIGASNIGRDEYRSGKRQTVDEPATDDYAVYRTLILQQIQMADDLETRMKLDAPADFYSPHVMVRMDTTGELRAMLPDLRLDLRSKYERGEFKNPGWDVGLIYLGHNRLKYVEPAEYQLAARDQHGKFRHPFMRARNSNGQCREGDGSKRVLLMCNIGVRGINNWTIQSIVDCTDRISVLDQIQFDFGRPGRWPTNRAHWLFDKTFSQYARMSIAIAPRARVEAKQQSMRLAQDFIENMQQKMSGAGFLTWHDLLSGAEPGTVNPNLDLSNRALTAAEKYGVQAAMATVEDNDGPLDADSISRLIEERYPTSSTNIRNKLIEYAARLTDPPFRDHEVNATQDFQMYQAQPECVIDKLQPLDHYPADMLKTWVRSDPGFRTYADQVVEKLEQGDVTTLHLVSDFLRSRQHSNYRSPHRVFTLHGEEGVITEVARELAADLRSAGQAPVDRGEVPAAVITAAKIIFGIEEKANEGGPLDHPPYHIAIIGRLRRRIQAMARARLIADGKLGPSLQKFAAS